MADASVKNEQPTDETDGINEPMDEIPLEGRQDMENNRKQENYESNKVKIEPLVGVTLDIIKEQCKNSESQDHKNDNEPMEESVSNQDLNGIFPFSNNESQKVIMDLSKPMEQTASTSVVSGENNMFGESVTSCSKDKNVNNKDVPNVSDNGSNEDSSKRQKLNDDLPNTSSESNECESVSDFRKLMSKYKNRNYRNQSSSCDNNIEETSEPPPADHESSNSIPSIGSPVNTREGLADSSDERSETAEELCDSNDTSISDDEMPAVLQKEPSKTNWNLLKDVVNRQIGLNNNIPQRFYGSLHVVQRLELMYKLEEHVGCVNALGFNQQGNLLASASDDLLVTIWDWAIGKKRVVLPSGHRSNVFQSKWLPLDECFVISCGRDGQVRLIDIRKGVTRKLAHHRAACHKISNHLDLPHVVLSAGEDSKVLCIDVRENKPSKLLSVKDNDQEVELYSIHSNPLNNFEFCVAGRTRTVKIYDRRKPTAPLYDLCPKHLISDELAHVTCAVYNHNGTEVIASYNSEDIYLFDSTSSYQKGDFAHKYQGHRNSATVKGVNFFGPNSEYVLSGSDCGNIFIWDKKTEAIVQWMAGDEQGIVNALEPHPHIPVLATSGLDYDVKIWIPSREKTPDIKSQLQSFFWI
ncbi:DDB1- and CUL4-associated factor 8-like isoform X2 [Phymastichus coffea]|uniref:DDB1- and CUL4-associated factor 8-like isoform X2 n=1 Tax=Phymastichus coffea TaxID=108790 RepID=UPI00273B6522|nr:DDB1- and CUL4-associated factor 8-like isoform X2 [Phymastichus coffea]